MNEKINKKEVNKMITIERVIHYNNKTITIKDAIKCMDGKGGYTKEYLETKTPEQIDDLWITYVHTGFID